MSDTPKKQVPIEKNKMSKKTNRDKTVEARRKLIIETAALCFIEQGFHQTSIRDIANRANISLGNLYNHFESKSALIAEIATLEAEDLEVIEKQVLKISDTAKALDKFINLYSKYCARHENVMLSAEIISEGLRNPDVGKGFLQNRERLLALVGNLASAHNGTRQTKVSRFTINFIIDLIEGMTTRNAFEHKKLSKSELTALKESIAKIVHTNPG